MAGTMTLREWLAAQGVGGRAAIAKATGLRWQTVHDIARGESEPKPATARAIEAATGGAVSAASLLGLDTVRTPDGSASPADTDGAPETEAAE